MRNEDHRTFERLFLGTETDMGEWMDFPSVFLKSRHRQLFHTVPEAIMLSAINSLITGKNFAVNLLASLLHIFLDNLKEESYNGTNAGRKNIRRKDIKSR